MVTLKRFINSGCIHISGEGTIKSKRLAFLGVVFFIVLSSAVAAAGPFRQKLEGFDFSKLDDASVQSNKYRAGRVFENYAPDSRNLNAVVFELRRQGNNVAKVGFDEIDFNDGPGAVDVIRASDVEGGGEAWQWIVQGTPHHAPTLRITSPNGGEVWEIGSTQSIRWSSRTFSSNTLPSESRIIIQFFKSSGERHTFPYSTNDDFEQVNIGNDFAPGLYKAKISTVYEGKTIEDFSDDFFTIKGAQDGTPSGTVFVNSFEEGTNKPIVADFQILRDGQVVFANQHSATIEYTNQPIGTYELQVFPPAPSSAYEWPPRFDQSGPRTLTSNGRVGWNMHWKLKTISGNNAPVISSCNPRSSTINTGERVTIDYHITDPQGDSFSVRIDWGDGETSTTNSPTEASHTYSRAGTFRVKITATDSKGDSSQEAPCGPITVVAPGNRAPVISSCNPTSSTVAFGSPATINFAVSDPDGDPVTVVIFWGDGTSTTTSGSATSAAHTYASAGTFNVEIVARDGKEESRRSCQTITVTTAPGNRAPIISSCGAVTQTVGISNTARINYAISDPDGDSFTVVVDWGDGQTSIGSANSASHVYTQAGTFTVTIRAIDSRGLPTEQRQCSAITVVMNRAPVVSSCSPVSPSVRVGETATINYAISDPDGDSFTVVADWGDGQTSVGTANAATHVYTRGGLFAITLIVTDSKGLTTRTACSSITVNPVGNNPPVISSCNPVSSSITVGSTATINYAISDPDGDTFTVEVDWGDGSTSIGQASSATHPYTRAGTFTVSITAVDSRGARSQSRSCGTVTVTTAAAGGNTAPQIASCTLSPTSVLVGGTVNIVYTVTDPEGDAVTNMLSLGDGTTMSGGASSAAKSYPSAGTFEVVLTSTDSRGAPSSRSCGLVAVSSGILLSQPLAPRGAKLIITDVDAEVDGKKDSNLKDNDKISEEAGPESDVEFKITVKNNFTSAQGLEIEDVTVKITIEGIDEGSDLEAESREFDLSPGDDKKVTLRFKLPLNVDEGSFDVLIEAEGEDENGNEHKDRIDLELEVEKEKHDLRFLKFSLSKQAVNCDEPFMASYQVINLGQEDEAKAAVEIKSAELGIDAEQTGLSIKSGTEDNTISKSQTLRIGNNVEDGTYMITADVLSDDGKSRDTKTASLDVKDCPEGEIKVTESAPSAKTVVKKIPVTTSTVQVVGTETVQRTLEFPIIRLLSGEGNGNMLLLVASTFMLSIFLLIVGIVLFIRLED